MSFQPSMKPSSTQTPLRMGAKPLVVIESPFAAPEERGRIANRTYAGEALYHSIENGEAPFAGHLLYTQVLDDFIPEERALGIALHIEYLRRCDLVAVYTDRGISPGMRDAIEIANRLGKPVTYRVLK